MKAENVNQYVEDALKLRGRIKVVHPLCSISNSDVRLVHDDLAMRIALLDDLLPETQLGSSFRRNVLNLSVLDIQSYFSDWKVLDRVVKTSIELSVSNWGDWQSFKQTAGNDVHYTWILSSLRPFFEAYSGTRLLEALNQWICFDSRLNLRSLNLATACCQEYLEDERAMSSWDYDPSLLGELAEVMSGWLRDYSPASLPFCPKHGPGAVADLEGRRTPPEKTSCFNCDESLREFIEEVLWEDVKDVLYEPSMCESDEWRQCTLVCVPKSPLVNRTISKEPVSLQWCQQGLSFGLDEYFRSHPSLSIDLHHQEWSRTLALEGSDTGEFCTIDLSKASDSVTLALVRGLFADTDLLSALEATRSKYCLVHDGHGIEEVVTLSKFAPMGSSLCFPIECLVFACVCELAVRKVTGRRSLLNDFRVYGDDIVIRQSFEPMCREILSYLHFTVNSSKSYRGTGPIRFREACGLEACNGHEITPLRLSRRLLAPSRMETMSDANTGAGLVDLINQAYMYGYRSLRRLLNEWAAESPHFHTVFRVDATDYSRYSNVVQPHFIVDDMTATQWKARSRFSKSCWRREHYCSVFRASADGEDHPEFSDDSRELFLWEWQRYRDDAIRMSYSSDPDYWLSAERITYSPVRARWARKWVGLS